ncbi:MAG: hypothetical protein H6Q29_809 [Bacteroidetes bacterium]|nr:hypothetical protein [Bacteroidota bacterium]
MPSEVSLRLPTVVGEVVEVYHSGGTSVATLALRPLHVSIPAELLEDPHLGEKVSLDVDLTIRECRTLRASGYPASDVG